MSLKHNLEARAHAQKFLIRTVFLYIIRVYQKVFSPDHGIFSSIIPYSCIYKPTCSEYTYQAIEKYGIIKGSFLGIKRIMRCHPWHKGGEDPVP